ncbi:hypothetical protein HDU76_000884, partial [Blyttiomyces sp. JEL0837]
LDPEGQMSGAFGETHPESGTPANGLPRLDNEAPFRTESPIATIKSKKAKGGPNDGNAKEVERRARKEGFVPRPPKVIVDETGVRKALS